MCVSWRNKKMYDQDDSHTGRHTELPKLPVTTITQVKSSQVILLMLKDKILDKKPMAGTSLGTCTTPVARAPQFQY